MSSDFSCNNLFIFMIQYFYKKLILFKIDQIKMFLFKCCQQVQTGKGYQVRSKNQNNEDIVSFYSNLNDIDPQQLQKPNFRVTKLSKSPFEELINGLKDKNNKYTDSQFPPEQISLGNLQGIEGVKWKRISEFIKKPKLISQGISPRDVVKGNLGDCYFLSAISALAERPAVITNVLGSQEYNQNGIYRVALRKSGGQVEEVIVDDFIPLNQNGDPLFCQPNFNEFWTLIFEKAWAKAKGSYANIAWTPNEVFKAFTFAPSEMILVKRQDNKEKQKLWDVISQGTKNHYPICCNANEQFEWQNKLVPSHAYTVLKTAYLQDNEGQFQKVVKLRDPWCESVEWQGEANVNDGRFWSNIISNEEKDHILEDQKTGNQGIIFMTFEDFYRNFSQIHVSKFEQNGNYLSEQLKCNKKNGNIYQIKIKQSGNYTFQLHQGEFSSLSEEQKREQGFCRSTFLIIRVQEQNNKKNYTLVNGILKYNEEDTILTEKLQPGKYILYAKLDPTRNSRLIPDHISVSVYSSFFTTLQNSNQNNHPDLLKKVFLEHAKKNIKSKYNNDLMWISWKLLFQQGGYAYIAIGNDPESNKKFIITFDEEQFDKMNFKMKKDFKGKGQGQRLQVFPGEQKIILVRVKNELCKSMKFPPHIGIKMELV